MLQIGRKKKAQRKKKLTCKIPYFNSISKKLYSLAWVGLGVAPGGGVCCDAPVLGGPVTFPPDSFFFVLYIIVIINNIVVVVLHSNLFECQMNKNDSRQKKHREKKKKR